MRHPARGVLPRRVVAYALDAGVAFAVLAPAGWGLQTWLGWMPETPRELYAAIVVNFSVPVWIYFAWSDASTNGATLGKRLLGLRTEAESRPLGVGRALARTAVKMAPWELTHASAFLLAPAPGMFGPASWVGLGAVYALVALYLGLAARSHGARSVHDHVARTRVVRARRALAPR